METSLYSENDSIRLIYSEIFNQKRKFVIKCQLFLEFLLNSKIEINIRREKKERKLLIKLLKRLFSVSACREMEESFIDRNPFKNIQSKVSSACPGQRGERGKGSVRNLRHASSQENNL